MNLGVWRMKDFMQSMCNVFVEVYAYIYIYGRVSWYYILSITSQGAPKSTRALYTYIYTYVLSEHRLSICSRDRSLEFSTQGIADKFSPKNIRNILSPSGCPGVPDSVFRHLFQCLLPWHPRMTFQIWVVRFLSLLFVVTEIPDLVLAYC